MYHEVVKMLVRLIIDKHLVSDQFKAQMPLCSLLILSSAAIALCSLSNFALISGVKPLNSSSLFSLAVFCTWPNASALPLPAAFPKDPESPTFGPSSCSRSVSAFLRSSSFCASSLRSRSSRSSASDLLRPGGTCAVSQFHFDFPKR